MKLAILSNVNLDMLIGEAAKTHEVFSSEGYGQWISYALQKNDKLLNFAPSIIFLIIDGNALLETYSDYDSGAEEIHNCFRYIGKLAENYPYSTIAVSNIDVRRQRICPAAEVSAELLWEAEWARCLAEAAQGLNIVPFDLKSIIETEGRRNFYSQKLWYTGSIPYGPKSFKPFLSAINDFAAKISTTRKKVLVLDLDNTLWGGVVGEDGADGIVLGQSLIGAAYRDAQKRIKELAATGILLAIASKNNPEDVQAVFRENPHMVLKEEDFVSVKANWEPKFVSIRDMADELNLGLDSFVFLDDNEVEREAVRANLPQVTVADFPRDAAKLPQTICDIYEKYFWCVRETAEDKNKAQQYHEETNRKKALESAASMDDYLKSLNMVIAINEVRPNQFERTVQLLNKTNQFNTNTVRMDMPQFLKYVEDEHSHVYVANVSDKYGSSGLVAVMLTRADGNVLHIENFLMSCRVMGRQIEDSIVFAVEKQAESIGIKKIASSYKPTAKNKPVENLWDRLGFELVCEKNGEKHYELSLPNENEPLIGAEWR
ncbi:MAG: HAD-IIIC family phosphatase [Oscillospiraceae bacterium]|nr:HAD-IIIC family phosphatase [Oscillospiraceae bacterium]